MKKFKVIFEISVVHDKLKQAKIVTSLKVRNGNKEYVVGYSVQK